MITTNVYNLENDTNYQGLSTDQKPRHGVATNSMMLELDTGNIYYCIKGSVDVPRKEVLPETTFTGEITADGTYDYEIFNVDRPNSQVTVIFDGVLYDSSGAKFPREGEEWDFSKYPYSLLFVTRQPIGSNSVVVIVPDDNEHTVEIYTEGYSAEWRKAGEKVPEVYFEASSFSWRNYSGYANNYISTGELDEVPKHPENVVVVFDDEEYECTLRDNEDWQEYGAPFTESGYDFSEYPFCISFLVVEGEIPQYEWIVNKNTLHTIIVREVIE